MATRLLAPRRARFEPLEQKQLLAGDVLVSVSNGGLMIEGDEAANQIAVTAGAEAGSFVITGLEGTNIRLVDNVTGEPGDAMTELTVNDIHRNVQIDLGAGDDVVSLGELNFRGNVSIETGEGMDRVLVGEVDSMAAVAGDASVGLRGSLQINTGVDNDEVVVGNASVHGRLGVHTGEGDDSVVLGGMLAAAAATNGTGMDSMATLKARGGVNVNLGAGDDELAAASVNARGAIMVMGGEGDDSVNVESTHAARILALLGDGADEGTDTLNLNGVHAHHLGVSTGAGADNVEIVDSAFMAIGVHLGDGDDTLAHGNVTARFAALLGGMGEDTLEELSDSMLGRDLIRGFELPPDVVNTPLPGRRLGNLFGRGLGRLR